MTRKKVALVTGATGVVGRNLIEHLCNLGDWEIAAVSRRKPEVACGVRHIPANLMDSGDCAAALGGLTDITHIFHCAYVEMPTRAAMVQPNLAMLANTVETVERSSRGLEHVLIMQGTKYYGSHLGPFKTPAKEDDPRHAPPNFYYDLQDYVSKRSAGKSWSWSAPRPHAVIGFAVGNPMNLSTVIAVYATLCKDLGLPLAFPGTDASYNALYQCSDAQLLARSMVWMATTPECANQAFNIINGDLIRWKNVWPAFARFFDMEAAPPCAMNLATSMADKGPLWKKLVARHGLKPYAYDEIVSWPYGDIVFSTGHDIISDTGKARRFGFHDVIGTEELFLQVFESYRKNRVIP